MQRVNPPTRHAKATLNKTCGQQRAHQQAQERETWRELAVAAITTGVS